LVNKDDKKWRNERSKLMENRKPITFTEKTLNDAGNEISAILIVIMMISTICDPEIHRLFLYFCIVFS